jgi:arginase
LDVSLIAVPYHAGDDRQPASRGPSRLLEAGAAELLRERGLAVEVLQVDRGGPFRDTASSAAAVNRQLATIIGAAVARGALPIVLSGSCNSALGVLAGFDHSRCGALWIDAHADFNTPESSATGFFPGMSVAIVTGHCYRDYWSGIGDSAPLDEENVVMVGVRDLSPQAEKDRVAASRMVVIRGRHSGAPAAYVAALDSLRTRVRDVYLHIDFDGFDPQVAPGVVDEPAPGGLFHDDALLIIEQLRKRFRIRAATLATYAPAHDRDDRTLRLGMRLVDLLGQYATTAASGRPEMGVAGQ